MSKKRGREPKASDERRSLLGVAWYRRDNWERLREISSDREALEDTYEEWLANAETSLPKLARQGMAPVKVHIDIEEGGLWGHIFICQKLKEAFSVRS